METVTVIACAIRDIQNGQVYQVPKPGRHHDVLRKMRLMGLAPVNGFTQGFVLSDGRFVDRVEAKAIAIAAVQLLERASGSRDLFSEDLW